MDYGLVLFTSDRGITPAAAAKLADDHGFATFYVPEHTHIPVKRQAAHPTTGDESLPDDRYMRTLDPWVSLGAAAAVTSRVRLSTAVALPVEHDPITLAKSIATLDHLSGGRVSRRRRIRLEHRRTRRPQRAARAAAHHAARIPGGHAGAVDPGGGVLRGRVRQLRPELGVAEAGAVAHPGAGRRGRHREELQVDRPQRRRLDHHPARLRHRRAGQAAAGHLGRRRPRRRTADRRAGLQARSRQAGPLGRPRRHRGAVRPARQVRGRGRRLRRAARRASSPRWSDVRTASGADTTRHSRATLPPSGPYPLPEGIAGPAAGADQRNWHRLARRVGRSRARMPASATAVGARSRHPPLRPNTNR